MKSDLKFVEASAFEVATIASPTIYADRITSGVNGEIAESPSNVASILKLWAENPSKAKNCAQNARQWVKSQRLQKYQTPKRLEWYISLWERREELTKLIYERVPELRPRTYS